MQTKSLRSITTLLSQKCAEIGQQTKVQRLLFGLKDCLRGCQTSEKVGQLLWAWFSCRRKSADEIIEPWHTSLVTSRQWRQKMADDEDADAFMLLYFLSAKQHKNGPYGSVVGYSTGK